MFCKNWGARIAVWPNFYDCTYGERTGRTPGWRFSYNPVIISPTPTQNPQRFVGTLPTGQDGRGFLAVEVTRGFLERKKPPYCVVNFHTNYKKATPTIASYEPIFAQLVEQHKQVIVCADFNAGTSSTINKIDGTNVKLQQFMEDLGFVKAYHSGIDGIWVSNPVNITDAKVETETYGKSDYAAISAVIEL